MTEEEKEKQRKEQAARLSATLGGVAKPVSHDDAYLSTAHAFLQAEKRKEEEAKKNNG